MSASSRAERRRYKGTPVSVVADRHRLARSPMGEADSALLPEQHVIRAAIDSGICPWCKRGPFLVLARHVNNAHGIDRFELRERAGLTRHVSICDPSFAKKRREIAKRIGSTPPVNRAFGRKLTMSTAGRERLRVNGQRTGRLVSPTKRSEMGKQGGRIRGDQLRKERQPCAICGGVIPYISGQPDKRTCSPECLRESKSRSMSAWRRRADADTHRSDG